MRIGSKMPRGNGKLGGWQRLAQARTRPKVEDPERQSRLERYTPEERQAMVERINAKARNELEWPQEVRRQALQQEDGKDR